MARPLRIEFPGAIYHITARGNRLEDIFFGDPDREMFLEILASVCDRFGWLCHAYCLMGNHYHLLLETPTANLGRGMRQLNGVFSQKLNWHHGRVGHVFQGRYRAILVEREAHLLELARYVVLNPVRAGLVKEPINWPWSSYTATAGDKRAPAWLNCTWLLSCFGSRRTRAAYRRFVAEGHGADSPLQDVTGGAILGSQAFVAKVWDRTRSHDPEIPRHQRHFVRPSLAELRKQIPERADWMATACRLHGYTMSEVAAEAGLHYSSVSKVIKAWEAEKNSQFKT